MLFIQVLLSQAGLLSAKSVSTVALGRGAFQMVSGVDEKEYPVCAIVTGYVVHEVLLLAPFIVKPCWLFPVAVLLLNVLPLEELFTTKPKKLPETVTPLT